jgi:hypothetical protein
MGNSSFDERCDECLFDCADWDGGIVDSGRVLSENCAETAAASLTGVTVARRLSRVQVGMLIKRINEHDNLSLSLHVIEFGSTHRD